MGCAGERPRCGKLRDTIWKSRGGLLPAIGNDICHTIHYEATGTRDGIRDHGRESGRMRTPCISEAQMCGISVLRVITDKEVESYCLEKREDVEGRGAYCYPQWGDTACCGEGNFDWCFRSVPATHGYLAYQADGNTGSVQHHGGVLSLWPGMVLTVIGQGAGQGLDIRKMNRRDGLPRSSRALTL